MYVIVAQSSHFFAVAKGLCGPADPPAHHFLFTFVQISRSTRSFQSLSSVETNLFAHSHPRSTGLAFNLDGQEKESDSLRMSCIM
jgi:hypothetical protein